MTTKQLKRLIGDRTTGTLAGRAKTANGRPIVYVALGQEKAAREAIVALLGEPDLAGRGVWEGWPWEEWTAYGLHLQACPDGPACFLHL